MARIRCQSVTVIVLTCGERAAARDHAFAADIGLGGSSGSWLQGALCRSRRTDLRRDIALAIFSSVTPHRRSNSERCGARLRPCTENAVGSSTWF